MRGVFIRICGQARLQMQPGLRRVGVFGPAVSRSSRC